VRYLRTAWYLTLVLGLLALAGWGWHRYEEAVASAVARRLARNETAIRALYYGLAAYEATGGVMREEGLRFGNSAHRWGDLGESPATDDLWDLLQAGILDELPRYVGADGRWKPFVYVAGVTVKSGVKRVWLAAPETEPDGTLLLVFNNGACRYLPAGEGTTALRQSQSEMEVEVKRIPQRKKLLAAEARVRAKAKAMADAEAAGKGK